MRCAVETGKFFLVTFRYLNGLVATICHPHLPYATIWENMWKFLFYFLSHVHTVKRSAKHQRVWTAARPKHAYEHKRRMPKNTRLDFKCDCVSFSWLENYVEKQIQKWFTARESTEKSNAISRVCRVINVTVWFYVYMRRH